MKDWLAKKRQQLSRKHPDLSEYKPGDLVYVTAGGTYQGKIAEVGPFNRPDRIDLLDPFTLSSLTYFISKDCVSPALEHEVAEVAEMRAGDKYFMTKEVVLRRDAEAKQTGDFSPVYKIIAVSSTSGGVKLENIETGDILMGENGEPEYIMRAVELRPPNTDEMRNARVRQATFKAAQVSGPDSEKVRKTVSAPTEEDTALMEAAAANTDTTSFDMGRSLGEMEDAHTQLAHRIGNLKVRTPFKQALAASKSGATLTSVQKSAVEFIEGMEDALRRARDAQRAVFEHTEDFIVRR